MSHGLVVAVAGALAAAGVVAATPAPPAPDREAIERQIVEEVNALRSRRGAEALTADLALTKAARAHSCDMARAGRLSHQLAAGGLAARMKRSGQAFSRAGENIAVVPDTRPVQVALRTWLDSPPHRDNILQPEFSRTGVGACRAGAAYYVTQIFLRPPSPHEGGAGRGPSAAEARWGAVPAGG
jgi:uncharacterized protein YkwD